MGAVLAPCEPDTGDAKTQKTAGGTLQSTKTSALIGGQTLTSSKTSQEQVSQHLKVQKGALIKKHVRTEFRHKYKVVEKAEVGVFGTCEVAQDTLSNVKVLVRITSKRRASASPDGYERSPVDQARHEFNVLRDIDHPNVIKLIESYEESRRILTVFEHCDGGTVQQWMEEHECSGDQCLRIVRQVMSALTYIHGMDVTFRTLTAKSVVFTSRAYDETKLLGFEFSRLSKQADPEKGLLPTQDTLARRFQAPEILRKSGYTVKADSWSVGVLMYWLMSGGYPFKGDTEEKLLESLESDALVTTKGAWLHVPKAGIEVITALLQVDDKRRRKCEDVLGMEYFENGAVEEVSIQCLQMAAKNLKEYSKLNVLEKGARTALAWSIPNDKSAELRLLFRTIDTDGSGSIDCKELGELLVAQALLQEDEAEELFTQLDTDGSGSLDYTEFLAATVSVHEGMEDELIRAAFRAVDTDDSGSVSRKELNSLFRGFREHVDMPELKKTKGHQFCDQARVSLGEKAIEKMLELYDENGDGDIDFEEFRSIIRGEGKRRLFTNDCISFFSSCSGT